MRNTLRRMFTASPIIADNLVLVLTTTTENL